MESYSYSLDCGAKDDKLYLLSRLSTVVVPALVFRPAFEVGGHRGSVHLEGFGRYQ